MATLEKVLRAASTGDLSEVQRLLDIAGDDTEAYVNSAMLLSAEHGKTEVVLAMIHRGGDVHANQDDALLRAARGGRTATVDLLLNFCADLRSYSSDALAQAGRGGHTDTVRLMLERGADPHACSDRLLKITAQHGNIETTALLLSKCAYPPKTLTVVYGNARRKRLGGIMSLIDSFRNLEKLRARRLDGEPAAPPSVSPQSRGAHRL